MKKALKITGVLLILLLLAGGIAWHYLPAIIVKSIMKKEGGITVIPATVRKSINSKVDAIPDMLSEMEKEGFHITIEEIIAIIDNSSTDEIETTVDALESTELKSQDQVINIVLQNMDLGKLEDPRVVAKAKEKMKMSDVKKAMKMIRENGKPYALTIPMGKETLKELLLEKKKEIETKLNS